jgi:hypothetical protein
LKFVEAKSRKIIKSSVWAEEEASALAQKWPTHEQQQSTKFIAIFFYLLKSSDLVDFCNEKKYCKTVVDNTSVLYTAGAT